jgi:hypothetical protein
LFKISSEKDAPSSDARGGGFTAFPQTKERRQKMNDTLILLLILAVWIFLQTWLLPRMGVST